MRKFSIWVDGKRIGEIGNGDAKEFDVTEGQHNIALKIDWCGSPEVSFHLQQNESKSFYVSGFKHGNWLSLVALSILALDIILRYVMQFGYLIFLLIPVLLYYMYFFT